MRVRHLVEAVERLAPAAYAEAWDRVGLHVGRPDAELRGPVLLTIDLIEAVLDEAEVPPADLGTDEADHRR